MDDQGNSTKKIAANAALRQLRVRDILAIVFLVATYPVAVAGMIRSLQSFRNDVSSWLAGTSDVKVEFEQFVHEFGLNETVFVSWTGCDVGDPRIGQFETLLKGERCDAWVASVVSAPQVVDTLVEKVRISRQRATERLRGVLIAPEGKQCGILVRLTDHAIGDRNGFFELLSACSNEAGIATADLRTAGIAVDLYWLDQEGLWSPLRAVPFIMMLSLIMIWLSVRRWDLSVFISLLSSYVGVLSISCVHLLDLDLNAVVWTLPTLTMLLTVSASLHFLGYYRYALRSSCGSTAVREAVRIAWRPTFLCALTTSAGLFSLTLSETPPVRQFGFFGGITVLVGASLVLSCLPAWLRMRPVDLQTLKSSPLVPAEKWHYLAKATARYKTPIILTFVALTVVAATAIPRLRTSVNNRHMFQPSSKVIQDTMWLETRIAGQSAIELLVRFNGAKPSNDLERLRLLGRVVSKLSSYDSVSGILSPLTWVPTLQRPRKGISGVLARKGNEAKLRRLRGSLLELGYVSQSDAQAETWRITMMTSSLRDYDRQALVDSIGQVMAEAGGDQSMKLLSGEELSWTCTGQPLVFLSVEDQFISDLRTTYATAFCVILLIMASVVHSVTGCMLLALPNVFPAVFVIGSVSMFGVPLDVASLMTASVALGIGVDDTLHYALWWRKRVQAGFTPTGAIADSMDHCGSAMLQTSVVTGTSMLLYMFCGFFPTVRFGMLLAAMLFAALVADLLLLPALLSSRLAGLMLRRARPSRLLSSSHGDAIESKRSPH